MKPLKFTTVKSRTGKSLHDIGVGMPGEGIVESAFPLETGHAAEGELEIVFSRLAGGAMTNGVLERDFDHQQFVECICDPLRRAAAQALGTGKVLRHKPTVVGHDGCRLVMERKAALDVQRICV